MRIVTYILTCLMLSFAGCNGKTSHTNTPAATVTPPAVTPATQIHDDRAGLVGINKYPGAPLNGCVNDARSVHDVLTGKYGFKENQIRCLLDEEATTANIIAMLKWVAADAKPGDRRYVHLSGHGTQDAIIDVGSEPDRLNEIFCPVDFDWKPEHMIVDKQFVNIFSAIPKGVCFNWCSDSCHSGDLSRRIIQGLTLKPRSYPNVPDAVKARIKKLKRSRGVRDTALEVGYISGCKSDQTSADVGDSNGNFYGAFTHYFLQALETMDNAPLKDLGNEINQALSRGGFDQRPQVEGTRAGKPFLK